MYCRGHELIKQICKNRNIEPVVYLKLLNRQHIISDANGENLNDSYVLFKYINKNTPNKTDTICCSSIAAKDLYNISHTTMSSLFNTYTITMVILLGMVQILLNGIHAESNSVILLCFCLHILEKLMKIYSYMILETSWKII